MATRYPISAELRMLPGVPLAAAVAEPYVIINAGQRGVMVRLAPADAVRVLGAVVAPLVA